MLGVSNVSCGKCWNTTYPCEDCLKKTLVANGIPEERLDSFKGLSKINNFSPHPWTDSPLASKILEYLDKKKIVEEEVILKALFCLKDNTLAAKRWYSTCYRQWIEQALQCPYRLIHNRDDVEESGKECVYETGKYRVCSLGGCPIKAPGRGK